MRKGEENVGEEWEKRRKRGVGHCLGHGVAILWPTLWPTGGQMFKLKLAMSNNKVNKNLSILY